MPAWIYDTPAWMLALGIVVLFEVVSLGGLYITRRFVLPHVRFHDGVNDAISGTIQAIGVFYGITVGLIAVGVWNNYASASGYASQEAAAITMLYRAVSSYPAPEQTELQNRLAEYTASVIDKDWPAHRKGEIAIEGMHILTRFQKSLAGFEPKTDGQRTLHAETWRNFSLLIEKRRMRVDAVTSSLSGMMWVVIWAGAAISIAVGYFFYFEDGRLHAIMVGMMAAFLAIVVLLIITNDRPFMGDASVSPSSYQLILDAIKRAQ